jgi:hypothetical protein
MGSMNRFMCGLKDLSGTVFFRWRASAMGMKRVAFAKKKRELILLNRRQKKGSFGSRRDPFRQKRD